MHNVKTCPSKLNRFGLREQFLHCTKAKESVQNDVLRLLGTSNEYLGIELSYDPVICSTA